MKITVAIKAARSEKEEWLCGNFFVVVGSDRNSGSWDVQVQSCFTSTETIRTIRDVESRTATSTFTQFLSSEAQSSMLLYVHRDRTDY